MFEGVLELTHIRQLQEASWALSGVIPEHPGHQFRSSGLAYEASTYRFTTVPATKSAPTPIFTIPNQPLNLTFDQIRGPRLGADLNLPRTPR